MKTKNIIAAAAAVLTCCSCSSYYQIATLSSKEVQMSDNGDFAQKAGELTIHYDFWSSCGDVAFTVQNDSDKDITLDLSRSFFVKNGCAYDYYLHRTFITSAASSVSRGRTVSTSRTSGSSVSAGVAAAAPVSTLSGTAVAGAGISSSASGSTGITGASSSSSSVVRSHSLEVEEAAVCIIPAHSSKTFGEYSVASGEYVRCGLVRNPSKAEKSELEFNPGNSPFVVENRLMFVLDGKDIPVASNFYVSGIQNVNEEAALRNVEKTNCKGKKGSSGASSVKYNIYASADRYYVYYSVYNGAETGRTR